ncbi:HNH endonuclease domain-containing protein [Zhengella mangrovi]|nr:HNH endonuclease domain-containing protein [Zhengella mangrovi]
MVLRFSFDLGTGSIGLAAGRTGADGRLEPLFAGARILPAQPAQAVARLGLRRKQGRYRKRRRERRRQFAACLRKAGLLPPVGKASARLFRLDPYELRRRALDRPVSLHALGRLLMHLHKRRGRPIAGTSPPGEIAGPGLRTLGEHLAIRHRGPVRGRRAVRHRLGLKGIVDPPPEIRRTDVIAEFRAIWTAQRQFSPTRLSDTLFDTIHAAFQDEGRRVERPPREDRRTAVVLAQLRQCMNAMERRFGTPRSVVLERPLPLPSGEGLSARHAMPPWAWDLLRRRGLRPTRHRRVVLALLARQEAAANGQAVCPYSGRNLKRADLFSGLHEIDHVLPVSRGGATAAANLVLCHAFANRQKANRTPEEAFAGQARWRQNTRPGAVAGRNGPMAHAMPDRRAAMQRLAAAAGRMIARRWPGARVQWVHPSGIAALRRSIAPEGQAGPSAKSLADNRNHAVDALLALFLATGRKPDAARVLAFLENATVTHAGGRKKTATGETRYGATLSRDGTAHLHCRRPLTTLSKAQARRIVDPALRERILEALEHRDTGTSRIEALQDLSRTTGIRRVRIARATRMAWPVAGGIAWVMPAGNAFMDIVVLPSGRWVGFCATRAETARKDWRPIWEKGRIGGKLVMRLRTGDLIELDGPEGERVWRTVRQLSAAKARIHLAAPEEGGTLARRHADPDDPFRWELVTAEGLRRAGARALDVTPAGLVRPRRSNLSR